MDERTQTDIIGRLFDSGRDAVIKAFVRQISLNRCLVNTSGKSEKVLLASTSPRRKQIISNIFGLEYAACKPDTSEMKPSNFRNLSTVTKTVALMKLISLIKTGQVDGGVILTSDTLIHLEDGTIIGKPEDRNKNPSDEVARYFLLDALPGRTQTVSSSIMVFNVEKMELHTGEASTKITFRRSDAGYDRVIKSYMQKGLHVGKAGAYGIQDPEILSITESVVGDPIVVIGLPIFVTYDLLAAAGIRIDPARKNIESMYGSIWGPKQHERPLDVYEVPKNNDYVALAKKLIKII